MAPREPSTNWTGEYPMTYQFLERSGFIRQGLSFNQQQRLQREQRRQINTERVASRPPALPVWEDRSPLMQMPAHLRQYAGRILQRQGESFGAYVNRLQRRHNQPVYRNERFGRPMR